MTMNKNITRISAVMLAVLTILGSMFNLPVSAANGDKVEIAFYYCYDSKGNAIKYQQTTSSNGYTVGSAGEELCRITANGKEAYCIEPGHSLYAGDQLTEGSSSVWNNLGSAKQKAVNLALLCGKPGSANSLLGTADEKWAATQLIVWEIVTGCRETSGSYKCTNTKFINGITANGANSGVKTAYNQIVSSMQSLETIPSFAANSSNSAKTYEMTVSNGSYTLTLTDSNNVLSKFDFKTKSGIIVSRSGSKLTLTSKNPVNTAVTFSASKSLPSVSTTLIAYGDSGLQDVVTGVSSVSVNAYFKVAAKSGNLKLVKTSEDGIVANIEFTIKGTNYNKTAKTNSKGEILLSDLVPGTYTVTEKVDSRYESQAAKTVKVEADKTATVTFKNTLRKGDLKIIKTSEDGIVANIEFTIKGTNYSKTAKTNSKGEILLSDLVPGTYTVTEKADSRYESQAAKTVKVEADKTATVAFKNTLRKGNLKIIKTSEDGIVADIEFTIKGTNYSKTAKTNSKGEILLSDLVPGTYTVTEKADSRYETQAAKTVKVEADKTATVTFKNTLKKWLVKIVKKDSKTGRVIPYAGAKFQIYNPNGKLVSINNADTFATDSNGYIITPQPLVYGEGYSIIEVQAPYGYVLDSTLVFFDINDENAAEENEITVIKTEKSDTPQKGQITVEKVGEIFSNVTSVGGGDTDDKGSNVTFPIVYQPEYSVAGLYGAVFEVYADEDITTPNGTVRVKKDTLVATLTTDESGKATSKQLYLGKYRIAEVKAPYGMILNSEPKMVELTYAGQNKKVTSVSAEIHNDRQKVKIDLQKIMSIDERFNFGLNNEIMNVTFGLYADEDIIAANGSRIPQNALIEMADCDENGFISFTTDLPFGRYYVQEISTDEHYILSDTKYPILFEYAGQDTETVNIKVNDGQEIVNELIYGSVKGLKIDRETEESVEGAVFGLFRNDATVFTEETAILISVSNEKGIFGFENVPFGNYIVREIKPADGFMPNDTNYPVTISEHVEVIEITAVNDRYPEIRTTAMIEGKKEVGATDVFTLEDKVEYRHLIPGKEYTVKGVLMDRTTGKPFTVDGKEIVSETVFTPEQPTGFVIMKFTFDAASITKETDIVVFENLYSDDQELAVHADIDDKNQTVKVRIPKIKTKAAANGKKDVTAEKKITITDTVSYENLTIGKEYKLIGILMNKATGKPMTVNGKEITSEITFTAEKSNGQIDITFTFDGSIITKDTDIVVFESLYHDGREIAVHTDISDKDQTVTVHPQPKKEIERPKTGDESNMSLFLGFGAVAIGGLISFFIMKFRRKDEDDDE